MTYLPTPVPLFCDADGQPLDNGYIYVGEAGQNARTNPIQVYWDDALTETAQQPVRTVGGYPTYQGAAKRLFIAEASCSITTLDKNGKPVLVNAPSDPAAMIGFKQSGVSTVVRTLSGKLAERFSALDLLGELDPAVDHGALLTAAFEARFGTLATSQSKNPVEIWFGDSRYIYNIETPIYVQQNYIRLLGNGAVLQCSGTNAIIGSYDGAPQILFGVEISGFTLKGSVGDDAIVIQSGSQCKVRNIRNFATVGLAIVHYQGTVSSQTDAIKSDATMGSAYNVIRETVLEKTPGNYFNSIHNTHKDALGYFCGGAGASFNESDSFHISGDFEACGGPGVDVINSRFGTVSVYTEVNGQDATNVGTDTPDDIRIRSTGGALISRSIDIMVLDSKCAGQMVNGVTPNNVHIIGADGCLVSANDIGGNIKIETGCERNTIDIQARLAGGLTNLGTDTINLSTRGRLAFDVGTTTRLEIDAYASGGSIMRSNANLLRLAGISSFGYSTTVGNNLYVSVTISDPATSGTVTFGVAEPDANYVPIPVAIDATGSSAVPAVLIRNKTAAGFDAHLSVAPGGGQAVALTFFILRTA